MARKPRDTRSLTPEEKNLWTSVTQTDKPLHKKIVEKRAPTAARTKPAGVAKTIVVKKALIKANTGTKKIKDTIQGNYADIDRNTAERFRKGNYPIDATLDLHGMTAQKAQAALVRFIGAHYTRQSRCLLVITGKGTKGEGVLKKALPGWLAHEDMAPMILAFDAAKAKHGGSGAFYVLLRRNRHV